MQVGEVEEAIEVDEVAEAEEAGELPNNSPDLLTPQTYLLPKLTCSQTVPAPLTFLLPSAR
jgi:hypothetical protein